MIRTALPAARAVANKLIGSARPHMLYQNTFYKGLDVTR